MKSSSASSRINSVLCVLEAPLVLLYFLPMYMMASWDSRRAERAERPKPLPRKRRALTLSEPRSGLGAFGRFPYEIRRMIFTAVLGDQHLCIDKPSNSKGRLTYIRYDRFRPSATAHGNSHTAILKTCRAIYIEAVGLLYSANTFFVTAATWHMDAFLLFCQSIRPWRLSSITDLLIYTCGISAFGFQSIFDDWKRLWGMIATQLIGLKTLAIHVDWESQRLFSLDGDLVKHMLQIRGLKKVQLFVHEGKSIHAGERVDNSRTRKLSRVLSEVMCTKREPTKPVESQSSTSERIWRPRCLIKKEPRCRARPGVEHQETLM